MLPPFSFSAPRADADAVAVEVRRRHGVVEREVVRVAAAARVGRLAGVRPDGQRQARRAGHGDVLVKRDDRPDHLARGVVAVESRRRGQRQSRRLGRVGRGHRDGERKLRGVAVAVGRRPGVGGRRRGRRRRARDRARGGVPGEALRQAQRRHRARPGQRVAHRGVAAAGRGQLQARGHAGHVVLVRHRRPEGGPEIVHLVAGGGRNRMAAETEGDRRRSTP